MLDTVGIIFEDGWSIIFPCVSHIILLEVPIALGAENGGVKWFIAMRWRGGAGSCKVWPFSLVPSCCFSAFLRATAKSAGVPWTAALYNSQPALLNLLSSISICSVLCFPHLILRFGCAFCELCMRGKATISCVIQGLVGFSSWCCGEQWEHHLPVRSWKTKILLQLYQRDRLNFWF